MARYSDAVCRLCRREGMKLYLKGERCFKEKCSFETRKGKLPAFNTVSDLMADLNADD